MRGLRSSQPAMRSSGGNKRRRTRELCCLRQQNLLTIAIVSLAVLLCLQVCLFLPLVLELPHVNGSPADNQLLAVSNGGNGSTEVEEDAWSEFHALPKSLGYRQAADPPLPTWSPIKEDQLIGYSAHWDIRSYLDNSMNAPYVRLLATQIGGGGFDGFGFTCHYFFENGTRTNDVRGAARAFGRRGLFIFCPAKELVRARKVQSEGPEDEGTIVVSYEVDAPASVSIGCDADKKCEGHWTFPIWGRDQLPRFFHENDAEERALREEFEAAAKAAEDAAAFDQDRTEEEKELRSAVVVAPAPKRVPSLPAKGNLGVCVRPAYGPWTSASHLVQFLIYYLVAGAEHFTFYGTNAITPHMYKVIRTAQRLGVPIEVLPWNCQYSYDNYRMHEYNQYMGINACLYWQLPYFRHVAVIDIDEFLTTRHHNAESDHDVTQFAEKNNINNNSDITRFADYLDELDARHPEAAGFTFQNNFFFPYDGSDSEFDNVELPFDIFHITESNGPFSHGQRSKAVLRPERVVATEIHTLDYLAHGFHAEQIPDAEAALFHYRRGDHLMSPRAKRRDTEMLRYVEAVRTHPLLPPLMEAVGANTDALPSWAQRVEERKRKEAEEKDEGGDGGVRGRRGG